MYMRSREQAEPVPPPASPLPAPDLMKDLLANGLNESLLLRIKLLDGLDAEASSFEADLAATRGARESPGVFGLCRRLLGRHSAYERRLPMQF